MILLILSLIVLAGVILSAIYANNLGSQIPTIFLSVFLALLVCVGLQNDGDMVSVEYTTEYFVPVNGYIVNAEGRYVTTENRFGRLEYLPISGGIPAKFEKDFSLLTITRKFKPNSWAWFNHTRIETKLTSIKQPALK